MSTTTMCHPTGTIVKWFAEFKDPERAFEDPPRTGCPSIITTDQNIQAVERIVMHDRQISVYRIAYKLAIPTTTVYEIISDHLGMKKVSTRWVPNLLASIQRVNRVDCCQELLQEREINSNNYFHRIVTHDEIWVVYYYNPLVQRKVKI